MDNTLSPALAQEWKQTIKDIMQEGFDCAMGGSMDLSEEENEKAQEEKYDRAIEKYFDFLQKVYTTGVEQGNTENEYQAVKDFAQFLFMGNHVDQVELEAEYALFMARNYPDKAMTTGTIEQSIVKTSETGHMPPSEEHA